MLFRSIRFLSQNQNAFNHSDISKIITAQYLQKKYGTHQMEKIELSDDFIIEIDIDENKEDFDWNKINYPNVEIKKKIFEVIYYSSIKNEIDKILLDIKNKNWDKRDDLVSGSRQLINVIDNLKESKYFERIQILDKTLIVDDLKNTLGNEGEYLKAMKSNSSQREKLQAVRDFKNQLYSDLITIDSTLNNITIKL